MVRNAPYRPEPQSSQIVAPHPACQTPIATRPLVPSKRSNGVLTYTRLKAQSRSQVTGHKSQVLIDLRHAGHRSQVTVLRQSNGVLIDLKTCRSQVTGHRSQVTSHRSQVTGHKSRFEARFLYVCKVTGHGSHCVLLFFAVRLRTPSNWAKIRLRG